MLCCLLTLFSVYSDAVRSICIVNANQPGENEASKRLLKACERLHWQAKEMGTHPDEMEVYDFSLTSTTDCGRKNDKAKNNYLILYHPQHHFFDANGHLREEYRNYDGYLATYEDLTLLKEDLASLNKRVYPKPWYPTVQYRPYCRVIPTRLFYFLAGWGLRFHGDKYKRLNNHLVRKHYTRFFGMSSYGLEGRVFQGSIPFDGESAVNIISQMGVCLVLHSNDHIQHSIPSGRIFEAAAASAVIISDRNPFVSKHFGDSVLYIDETLSADEMFAQIDAHMAWILSHPEAALAMAKRSYEVYEKNFMLENQLLDFDRFHQASVNSLH